MLRLVGTRAARTGAAWCALGKLAGAQVAGIGVDPHMIVLSPARPGGEITVLNPHASRAEFSVDLRFGFATTDSSGRLTVQLSESTDSASAAGWVTAYPARFTLRGGAARTVRLLAQPPDGLADGEYWARLTVHARDEQQSVLDTNRTDSATVRVAMESATVIPVFFRKGDVHTGVTIGAFEATAATDAIDLRTTLTRTGTSAFIGVAHIIVRDSAGRTMATTDRQIAIYRSMRPRWSIALPAGTSALGCSVSLQLSTNRRDVPRTLLVQSAPQETVVVAVRQRAP